MEFTHLIDASSLAMVYYVFYRGLTNATQNIRARSAQLIGSLADLTDVRDFMPYFAIFEPELRRVVTDNDPDVRTAATSAIGKLIAFVGEEHFVGLKEWLLELLQSPRSTVARLGAAQGLAEYYKAVGVDALRADFGRVTSIDSPVATTRQASMYLVFFLCQSLKGAFADFIGDGLYLVVRGLSDGSELVRDAAMKAGSIFVRQFGQTHITTLLEVLDSAMYAENERVQECAINLVGELLDAIVASYDFSPDPFSLLRRKLGVEKIGPCLASLYVIRFDESHEICQRASLVWKKVVVNAGRALHHLIGYILPLAIKNLSLGERDRKRAAKCIGELVDQFSSEVEGELVSTLKAKLGSPVNLERVGACNGLVQVIRRGNQVTAGQLRELLPAVVDVLCDADDFTRGESGTLFTTIVGQFGEAALTQIVDAVLGLINDPETNGKGVRGFRNIVERSRTSDALFKTLSPRLLSVPVSAANARTLLIVCESSEAFFRESLGQIVHRFLQSVRAVGDAGYAASLRDALLTLMMHFPDLEALLVVFSGYLHGYVDAFQKTEVLRTLTAFFERQTARLLSGTDVVIAQLFSLLKTEKSPEVVALGWTCLEKLHMTLANSKFYIYINALAPLVRDIAEGEGAVLTLPADVGPLVRIEVDTLRNGLSETKDQAIATLGHLLRIYEGDDGFTAHRDLVIGPLINALSKQTTAAHRLKLLGLLLAVFETAHHRGKLKSFVLPTTIALNKILSEADRDVCAAAIRVYRPLIAYGLKTDLLLKEIQKGLSCGTNTSRIETYLELLGESVRAIDGDAWFAQRSSCEARGQAWTAGALLDAVYAQCLQLVPIATNFNVLLVRTLATMLKLMPDADERLRTLCRLDGFVVGASGDAAALRKEILGTYAAVFPDRVGVCKEVAKSFN